MAADERLLDLLAARATEGLDAEEQQELRDLLDRQHALHDDDLELAAAAAHVAAVEASGLEILPGGLRDKVIADAGQAVPAGGKVISFDRERPERRGFDLRGLGWYAAAAMLVLAIWAPWSRSVVEPPAAEVPDLAAQRAQLVAEAGDVVTAEWAGAEAGYDGVSGDVVWSTARQAGFMRLRGLPANRPTEQQYQLWIVDPARDAEPVDGGVFDIPAGTGEVLVPIDAKLAVGSPTVFAITLEQPGGVVVSEGPLLVVAPLT